MSNIGMIFCCDSGDCPAGSFCQSSTGGFAQCGSSGGGGTGGNICKMIGCGACTAAGSCGMP